MSERTGQAEVKSYTFIWKIDNFSAKCSNPGEFIFSPIFELVDSNKKMYWDLKLYPYGNSDAAEGSTSLFLNLLPQSTTMEYVCCYEISLCDGSNIVPSTKRTSRRRIFCIDRCWGWNQFIKRQELFAPKNILLKQDTLTISCVITEISSSGTRAVVNSLADEYECLYTTKDHSDISIVIGEKEIKAHRAILSARSKVFSAMLKHDMTENNKNIITISDVEYSVMDQFLSFLYSGKIVQTEQFAKPLLAVANEYGVDDLKLVCENILCSSIKVDNACELACIADLYNCYGLKSKIIDYALANMKDIMKTKGFDDLLSSNKVLFKEIFSKLLETRD